MSKSITFVVGRFQPLHNGHLHLIQHAIELADGGHTAIFIGSSNSPIDGRNPFTYAQRHEMLMKSLVDYAGLYTIHHVSDNPSDDEWVKSIQYTLDIVNDSLDTPVRNYKAVVCDKDDLTLASNNLFKKIPGCNIVSVENIHNLNSTDIRKKIFLDNIDVESIDDMPPGARRYLSKVINTNPDCLKLK